MLKNYLKVAWRNMQRNKMNSLINVSGLSIGMACVILIVLYVRDELSYDRFLRGADHIFQVNMTTMDNGVLNTTGGNTAPAVGPALVSTYPEIESYIRIYRPGDVTVRYEQNTRTANYFTESQVLAVDSNFLQVFNFPIAAGDAASCLQQPNSIVISESTAKKYFGDTHAIGKILLYDTDKKPFIVTAVVKNVPGQSTFQFDMLVPIRTYPEVKRRSWNWGWLQVNTYVKLRDNTPIDKPAITALEAKFPIMVKEHAFLHQDQTYEEFIKKGGRMDYSLMPFLKVHLYANSMNVPARLTNLGDIKYIYIFSAIALFVIILACVNFINLSTAQSATRAKEIGIRKVMGSGRAQLRLQFLIEALLYSSLATLLALVLVSLALPPFNAIAGKTLTFSSIFTNRTWTLVAALGMLTGMLAGVYPAFYLTSFNPVTAIKGMKLFKTNIGALFIRNGLVVLQFGIAITLIICTLIVFRQLKYIQEKNLGLNKENVVVLSYTKRLGNHEEAFRQELAKQRFVVDASISSSIPTKVNFGDGYAPEQTETDKPLIKDIGLSSFLVDDDFIPTLGLQIVQGRGFSRDFSDSTSVILNQTAAEMIGWKNAIGKYLDYPGNSQRFKVIGIVKDFNLTSLRESIEPFALFHASSKTYGLKTSYISARLAPGNVKDQLHRMEALWKSFAPDTPFDYAFLDAEFNALYRSEQRMGSVFGIFTFLSIFVACLGLFGLSVFTSERRKKEIGVRKVLGASNGSIVALLSVDFLRLVVLSVVFAFPVAWISMNEWLKDFVYRAAIGWSVFLVAGSSAIMIALLTIGFQAIKAAIANPANSLRTE
ncbi:MAG TPA: ABC transporter permease [Puia sp.]|nr:ABC transporter permease [Puia sp.]